MRKLELKEKITYERQYAFGKTGIETATVMMIRNGIALLDNGDEILAIIK